MNKNKELSLLEQAKWVIGDGHWFNNGMFTRVYSKTFKSKEDYVEQTIRMFNKIVSPDDITIFLGDLGSNNFIKDIVKRLNGRKVLIMGNHDSFAKNRGIDFGFDEVYDTPMYYNSRLIFSHEPVPTEPGVVNGHGHTHQIKLLSEWHINLCPEWWDFRPVSINHLLKDYVYNKPKPNRRFLTEWYKDIQISFQDNSEERFNLREDGTIISFKEDYDSKY